jgi:hypothetical protein
VTAAGGSLLAAGCWLLAVGSLLDRATANCEPRAAEAQGSGPGKIFKLAIEGLLEPLATSPEPIYNHQFLPV